jgi:hypothetical protein
MREVDAPADPLARFASRLLETPALRLLPALKKEEQALQFVAANGPQLQPVFVSLGLDMSRGWRGAAEAVSRAVKIEAGRRLEEELTVLARTRLALSFYATLSGGREAPPRSREELLGFFGRLAQHPVSRAALVGSMAAALSDLVERYVAEAWERKKYIHGEITRVQRLSMAPGQVAELLRFMLMIRPGAYLLTTPGERADRSAGYAPLQETYLAKILPAIGSMLPSFPAALISMGLRSTLAFPGSSGTVEATCRLAAVLAFRGRALSPTLVVDRGADSPDASWLNVTRRNARWHGLDQRILDEMYTMAAENGW